MKSPKITPQLIEKVERVLQSKGINQTAELLKISKRVVYEIKQGMYDVDPYWHNRCLITGFKYYKKR